MFDNGRFDATLAVARKERSDGETLDALLLEASLKLDQNWTLFTRAEQIETDELEPGGGHGHVNKVSRISLGAIRDWRVAEHATFGIGALVQTHLAPAALEDSYGGDPAGAMGFIRLKLQ